MAFADNLYLNLMPKRPDDFNGTKLLSEEPELAEAVRGVARLRRKFLPYFTDGVFLSESVLARPACRFVHTNTTGERGGALFRAGKFEYPPILVRGYRLAQKLLIIVLNNTEKPRDMGGRGQSGPLASCGAKLPRQAI